MARFWMIGGLIGLGLAGCEKPPLVPVETPPPEVTVALPVVRPVTEFYEYIGRTESPEFVEIRSRVSGDLTKIHFSDGKEVQAGDPLFEIDQRPYQFSLDNALARLERAEAQLKLASITFARTKSLNQSNAVSQQELDEATAQQDSANAEMMAAKAAVAQAQLDLQFCSITAPIAGRLSKANVTVGNLITAGQSGTPPLTTITSVDPIHVFFNVDEAAVLRFRELRRQQGTDVRFTHVRELNQKVQVALEHEKDFPHEGVLDFVDNRVQSSTGTLLVRAELPNSTRVFAPGFFVRVRIPLGEPQDAILVSDRAILNDQNLKYVLVADDQDIVQRRDVELGILDNGMRVIRSGLAANERVIVNGIQRARPGAKVRPSSADSSTPRAPE